MRSHLERPRAAIEQIGLGGIDQFLQSALVDAQRPLRRICDDPGKSGDDRRQGQQSYGNARDGRIGWENRIPCSAEPGAKRERHNGSLLSHQRRQCGTEREGGRCKLLRQQPALRRRDLHVDHASVRAAQDSVGKILRHRIDHQVIADQIRVGMQDLGRHVDRATEGDAKCQYNIIVPVPPTEDQVSAGIGIARRRRR